ncbi:hypothetical protein HEP84_01540 [Streptomyces sp. RLB1-33]|nr:hypothetical protein [Streptomyces sp. RLB1-33]QIY68169.1 hypothetical protein HEP84_01540 [Streptomyces sp. RLB1-33]
MPVHHHEEALTCDVSLRLFFVMLGPKAVLFMPARARKSLSVAPGMRVVTLTPCSWRSLDEFKQKDHFRADFRMSADVQRQYSGIIGRTENGPIGVFAGQGCRREGRAGSS